MSITADTILEYGTGVVLFASGVFGVAEIYSVAKKFAVRGREAEFKKSLEIWRTPETDARLARLHSVMDVLKR